MDLHSYLKNHLYYLNNTYLYLKEKNTITSALKHFWNRFCLLIIVINHFKTSSMLHLNLQAVFKARQIPNPYTFLLNAGFTSSTASRLLSGAGGSINLKHLTALCELLYCTPNELLEYKPNNAIRPQNHPLCQLEVENETQSWEEMIKTLPLSQLKEITKKATFAQQSS
jgi:DNA-binding Xre family transcriptional regulator